MGFVRNEFTSFLEPDVLERLCGVPVETGSRAVVAPTRGEIAERDPCARRGG